MQQHSFNVRVEDGIAVGEVMAAILGREGVEVSLLVTDCDHCQFIHEREITSRKAGLDFHFEDVLCDGVSVKNVGAVKVIQRADLQQYLLKHTV